MEAGKLLIRNETISTPVPNDEPKLNSDDAYVCNICPYPVKILKIDDNKSTVSFKCLNPKEKRAEKTIKINEYLDSMRKYTYLYHECSLCNKKQCELKNTSIFSYCIKCDKIICSDCIDKHLEINENNHHKLNKEYIIKNTERNIKCSLHPIEEN